MIAKSLADRTLTMQNMISGLRARDFFQWVDWLGVNGLFICGFGMLFKKSVAHFGLCLMALAFCLLFKRLNIREIRNPLLGVSVAFLVFILSRAAFASFQHPGYEDLIVNGSLKLLGTGFFLTYLFAFWMHRARGKWNELLLAVLAGYLVQILRNMEWNNLPEFLYRIWSGAERATFGFSTNRFGLFSAIVFLACLLLYRHLWGSPEKKNWYMLRKCFWSVTCLISLAGMVFSQSRSSWTAAFLVTTAILLCKAYQVKKLNLKLVMTAVSAVLLIVIVANAGSVIERRGILRSESYVTGFSSRFRLYGYGIEQWKEHPLVGHGPGTSSLLISRGGEKLIREEGADHFHNVFIDILVQIGIIGIGFSFLMAYLIIRELRRAKNASIIDGDFFLFCIGGVALLIAAGLSGQPFHSPHGVYVIGFLGGICYSFRFASAASRRTVASLRKMGSDRQESSDSKSASGYAHGGRGMKFSP